MNKLVIFDMDGLLVDSEVLHLKAWYTVFEKNGLVITEEEYVEEWIQGGRGIKEYFVRKKLGPIEDALKIREEKKVLFDQLIVKELEIKPGAKELLNNLSGKINLVLASASYKKSIEIIINKFDLEKYFEAILSVDDVTKAKPDPEIFLEAAKRMNIKPSECVVIEDAEKGLKAAKAAGMKCIIVPDQFTLKGDFSKADLIVDSLVRLDYKTIKEL